MTTHGYALNVDLDPAPFTEWITACGLEDAQFTTMARELGRPLAVDDVRRPAAAAIAEVFGLELEELRGACPSTSRHDELDARRRTRRCSASQRSCSRPRRRELRSSRRLTAATALDVQARFAKQIAAVERGTDIPVLLPAPPCRP